MSKGTDQHSKRLTSASMCGRQADNGRGEKVRLTGAGRAPDGRDALAANRLKGRALAGRKAQVFFEVGGGGFDFTRQWLRPGGFFRIAQQFQKQAFRPAVEMFEKLDGAIRGEIGKALIEEEALTMV